MRRGGCWVPKRRSPVRQWSVDGRGKPRFRTYHCRYPGHRKRCATVPMIQILFLISSSGYWDAERHADCCVTIYPVVVLSAPAAGGPSDTSQRSGRQPSLTVTQRRAFLPELRTEEPTCETSTRYRTRCRNPCEARRPTGAIRRAGGSTPIGNLQVENPGRRTRRPVQHLFPDLLSRNSAVRAFQGWLRAEHSGVRRVRKERAYPDYMALLREVGGRLNHSSPDRAEMVLFANVESLIQRAMGG